jgi:hypothetical protein
MGDIIASVSGAAGDGAVADAGPTAHGIAIVKSGQIAGSPGINKVRWRGLHLKRNDREKNQEEHGSWFFHGHAMR